LLAYNFGRPKKNKLVTMNNILLITIFTIFLSCSPKFYQPETLLTKRQDYYGIAFKTNGFYYGRESKSVYVFFRNGVIRDGWSTTTAGYLKETQMNELFNRSYAMNNPSYWGSFFVTDSRDLSISKCVEVGSWFGNYPQTNIKGKVLNDSMLLLTEENFSLRMPAKKLIMDTLDFHPMTVKPDSVNIYFEKWYK
jgi:hypothetical protein